MGSKGRSGMRVAILAGGISDEREISFESGRNVERALREAGYGHAEIVDPGSEGFLDAIAAGAYDVAFVALHGRGGEDGMVQSILEFLGIPYTGSDPVSSGCAMDKDLSKLLYARAGIATAPSVTFDRSTRPSIEEIVAVVGEQSFVKPVANGSSYGISFANCAQELDAAIDAAFACGDKVMVEQRVTGTEVTVGVLGDGPTLRALPAVEICIPEHSEFYDLDVKYVDPSDIHRIPARLAEGDYREVQRLACAAHEALGLFGFSRSDFIVTGKGPVILETNNIPGMTPASLFPDEAAHAGLAFGDVCAELIDLALERAAR